MANIYISNCMLKAVSLAVLLCLGAGCNVLLAQVAKNSQQLTTEAWTAFNKADFKTAIAQSEECIRSFKDGADDKQEELRNKNAPVPPTDEFSSAQREEILKRGPLNDVAASFFIIGESEEALYKKDKNADKNSTHLQRAKDAYKEACKYTYARVWDGSAKGFFWSPSKKACRRADRL